MRPYAVLHRSDRICCNNDRLLPALNAGDSYIIHTYGRSSSTYNVTLFKDIICIYCIERFKLICSTWALTSSVVSELLVSCARCLFALEKKNRRIYNPYTYICPQQFVVLNYTDDDSHRWWCTKLDLIRLFSVSRCWLKISFTSRCFSTSFRYIHSQHKQIDRIHSCIERCYF